MPEWVEPEGRGEGGVGTGLGGVDGTLELPEEATEED